MSTVREYLNQKFGAVLRYADKTAQTIATATQLLKIDPNRFGWVIYNLSPYDAFLGFNGQVDIEKGILIGPSGETVVSMMVDSHGELVTRELYGISINTCDLYLYEIIGM